MSENYITYDIYAISKHLHVCSNLSICRKDQLFFSNVHTGAIEAGTCIHTGTATPRIITHGFYQITPIMFGVFSLLGSAHMHAILREAMMWWVTSRALRYLQANTPGSAGANKHWGTLAHPEVILLRAVEIRATPVVQQPLKRRIQQPPMCASLAE